MMHRNSPHQNQTAHAYQLLQAGKLVDAERVCRNVLRADAANTEANNCLGVVQQRLGRPKQAAALFERVLANDPNFVPAYGNLASSLTKLGRADDAKRVVDRALNLQPELAIANHALGELGYQVAEYDKAATFYQRALTIEPTNFHSQNGLGMALRRLGRPEEALAAFERAIQLQPDNASIHLNLGNVLSDLGRIDEAAESYRQSIRLRPTHAASYQLLAGVRKQTSHDAELEAMEALSKKPGLSIEDRMNLAFGLGKAYEDLEQYDKAFEYFRRGNKFKRRLTPYSITQDVWLFERLRSIFSSDFIEQHQGLGSEDDCPIFVLGMPRSGTSLVEQILASHPEIHGAGELADLEIGCQGAVTKFPDQLAQLGSDAWKSLADDYLQNLRRHSATAHYITDKMPHNFVYIGMIAILLPKAKIVHCRRGPIDTCLSLFKNLFGTATHHWSYDIKDLGRYYLLYQELMAHWHSTLPGKIYDIQYENLVADPERQIRDLLNYCEIPFDPACLSFHESDRAVKTLSFAQVRQPIYSSSVQLWKRYERHLKPLASRLGET